MHNGRLHSIDFQVSSKMAFSWLGDSMLKNYFRVAFRNLQRNKGFSAINIVGLAIGLATCLLIMAYVLDELSYDRGNKDAARIYRVDGDIKIGGNQFVSASSPGPMGPILKQDWPEVEREVRFRDYGGFRVRKGSQDIVEEKVIYADSTLFSVFTLPMIAGDPATALKEPRTVVVTATIARKYFNSTDIVGRTLVMNDNTNYKITGVIKDVPANTHFNFDFFVSLSESDESRDPNQWVNDNFNTYLLLKKGVDAKKLEARFNDIVDKYIGPLQGAIVHSSMKEFVKSGNYIRYSLMPLTDIHLHSDKVAELGPNGSIEYVYIFGAIAAFILLIACVNFMNLSTARSSNRATEVGIRKVLGSLRSQLIFQFITESVVVSCIAMVLALGIAWLLLPYFNQLAGKNIHPDLLSRPWMIPALAAMVILVGLLAGSYPAFFLSAFRPVLVLKGSIAAGFRTGWLRNSLVVFQFGISILLIVGTMVIYNQLSFIRNKKIGFNREQVLVVQNCYALGDQAKAFKDNVLGLAGVQGATMTSFVPTANQYNGETYFLNSSMDQASDINVQSWPVDDQYIPVLGMEMAKGRNFSKEFLTDSQAVVINEAAARLMGLPDPVNHILYEMPHPATAKPNTWKIIGVVKDFNFNSLREQVTPVVLFPRADQGSMAFRIHSHDVSGLVAEVEARWKKMAPMQPFSYSFMDNDFNALYKAENRMGAISICFSVLAIFIACLGLFGLAAYAAEQRTREIGVRKVLGATVTNIVTLLSKDFLGLVAISAVIAFPLSWWFMHRWLQGFAYRISIGWPVFGLAALLVTVIALVTVSLQAIKAAIANPAKSLKSE
jgi:putative ABC transport system permease protein